jgi:hypothetical protein
MRKWEKAEDSAGLKVKIRRRKSRLAGIFFFYPINEHEASTTKFISISFRNIGKLSVFGLKGELMHHHLGKRLH